MSLNIGDMCYFWRELKAKPSKSAAKRTKIFTRRWHGPGIGVRQVVPVLGAGPGDDVLEFEFNKIWTIRGFIAECGLEGNS